jgi:TonB family protein
METTHRGGYTVLFAFALLAGLLFAIVSQGSTANTAVPVLVHRRIGSKPCELVQRGSLVIAKVFTWVEIEGEKPETYSPEMGTDDYLSASPQISGRTAEDAHKSGFKLRKESTITTDLPIVRALDGDADCPGLQGAIAEVEQARALRRAAVQARVYRPSTDDIVGASLLNEREWAPKSDQSTAPNQPTNGTGAKTKKKFSGTVVLNILIGTSGTVQQSKIVRSVDPELDKKAAEEVSRWKFAPATKKGLPVPSVMPVEITFNLQ